MNKAPLVFSLVLAACVSGCAGNTSAMHSSQGHVTTKSPPSRSTAPTGSTTADPGAVFPIQDTPFNSAPQSLQSAWAGPILSLNTPTGPNSTEDPSTWVIPGQEIFNKTPPLPPVTNGTNGALSDEAATALVEAFWRTSALVQWAEARRQEGIIVATVPNATWYINSDVETALNSGDAVADPNCDVYPSAIKVIAVTKAVQAWIEDGGGTASPDAYALVLTLPEGRTCAYTFTNSKGQSHTEAVPTQPNTTFVVTGAVKSVAPLGEVMLIDDGNLCGTANSLPQDC